MNRWPRLVLTVLAVWGVPAFFFWAGVGILLRVHLKQALTERLDRLDRGLTSFGDSIQPARFFEARLENLWRSLAHRSAGDPGGREDLATFSAHYPPGMVQAFLYDRSGRLLAGPEAFDRSAMADLFRDICRTWRDEISSPTASLQRLQAHLPHPEHFGYLFRQRPGELLVLWTNWNEAGTPPLWGWFQRQTPPTDDGIGGLLVFLNDRLLHAGELIREVIEKQDRPDLSLGFIGSAGVSLVPRLLSGGELSSIHARFQTESVSQFRVRNLLVEGRSVKEVGTLFVACPLPGFPYPIVGGTFLVYLGVSLALLLALYRHFLRDVPLNLSLRKKIAFLFFLGFAFPVVTSTALGELWLADKQEEILEENRREATRRLDGIDAGFNRFLGRLERGYRRLCGEFGDILSVAEIGNSLRQMQEKLLFEDFRLVASDSRLLDSGVLPVTGELMRIIRMPEVERGRAMGQYLKNGWAGPDGEIQAIFRGRLQEVRSRSRNRSEETDRILSGLRAITREIMDHFDRLAGFVSSSPTTRSDLALKGALESGGGDFLTKIKSGLNTLKLLQFYRDQSYTFPGVVQGADGRGRFFLLLTAAVGMPEGTYLEEALASGSPASGDVPVLAIPRPGTRGTAFPDAVVPPPLRILIERMESQGVTNQALKCEIDGTSWDVTAMRGHLLQNYYLVQTTPQIALEAKRQGFRSRVRILLGGTVLFGLLLAWLFIQRILLPLEDLDRGVRALQEKRFDHRIPARGNDELGVLCREYNHTIDHLQDMEMASVIQNQLLPSGGARAGTFGLDGRNLMTQAIGGDYFDFIPLADGRLVVILGDVAGHGVSAALVTAMAKAGFTLLCARHPDDPVQVLFRLHTQLVPILKRRKMMTVFLGILNPASGELRFVNGGQCLPLRFATGGGGEYLPSRSNPIGVLRKPRFLSETISLTGKNLLLYSDGLIEALNEADEQLGYDRFQAMVQAESDSGTPSLSGIFDRVRSFTGSVPWADDATAVLIQDLSPGSTLKSPANGGKMPTGRI